MYYHGDFKQGIKKLASSGYFNLYNSGSKYHKQRVVMTVYNRYRKFQNFDLTLSDVWKIVNDVFSGFRANQKDSKRTIQNNNSASYYNLPAGTYTGD